MGQLLTFLSRLSVRNGHYLAYLKDLTTNYSPWCQDSLIFRIHRSNQRGNVLLVFMQLLNKRKEYRSLPRSFRLIISDLAQRIWLFSVDYVTSSALLILFILVVFLFWKVLFFFISVITLVFFIWPCAREEKNPLKIRKALCSQCSNEGYWIKSIVVAAKCPDSVCVHFRSFRRSVRKKASSWVSLLCSSCQKTGRSCTASSHSTSTINVFNRAARLRASTWLCFVAECDLILCWCQRSVC